MTIFHNKNQDLKAHMICTLTFLKLFFIEDEYDISELIDFLFSLSQGSLYHYITRFYKSTDKNNYKS